MSLVAVHVQTVCPRCERPVAYSIGHDPMHGWYLVPEGRAETEYGYVWLAYRNDLRELVQEAFIHLARTFPEGATKEEMIREISMRFDLIPTHAETVLMLLHDEGLLYITRIEESEKVRWT
ncbi:MAG: hypothetical protein GXN93_04730 [Candidatus Diapherotrites archaeon]|nr:hypothetical protein [Candidatus Diapherotrites archaeon]